MALTGGIGSGKSEVSRLFESLNVPVVDVDVIAHRLTASNGQMVVKIAEQFGHDFLTADGAMDRAKMRDHVFANADERKKLEALLHPVIFAEACQALAKNQAVPYQILAIPLLFETNRYDSIVNRILLVDCDEATQIARTMARNHLSEPVVRAMMSAQTSRSERLKLADDIIENNASLADLERKVLQLHEKFSTTCQQTH